MRSVLCAILSWGLLLSGCSAHTQLSVNSGTPPPPAAVPASGTSITSGPAGLHVSASGSSGLAAAIFAAAFLAAAVNWSSEEHPFPDPSSLVSPSPAPPPALAPQRRVLEQDCTRPIADPYSNLRCR